LQDAPPSLLRSSPTARERIGQVARFRQGFAPAKGKLEVKPRGSTASVLAGTPTAFHVTVIPDAAFLVIPQVSSDKRDYIPIGWLTPPVIPSDKLRLLPNATLWDFGILTSQMHMAWMRQISGRMKSDYMYSVGVVYNNFPWPDATPAQRAQVEALAQAVLDARALPKNATSTLADLYDPDTMPAELRRAHRDLDQAVDRLYRKSPFGSDRERVEHLFALYQALVDPFGRQAAQQPRRIRRKVEKG
jgi:hypothetical protein